MLLQPYLGRSKTRQMYERVQKAHRRLALIIIINEIVMIRYPLLIVMVLEKDKQVKPACLSLPLNGKGQLN